MLPVPARRFRVTSVAATLAAFACGIVLLVLTDPRAARAQCTYTTLSDDTPLTFSTTPSFPRFTQATGRWAAVGVKSLGSSNWNIGLSLGTLVFPQCVQIPAEASQEFSGVDFVVADYAIQGTGTRYAPILRQSGTGSGVVEWDSGSRTAVLDIAVNEGPTPPQLLDCWSVDLVAGRSYKFWLFSPNIGDYTLYVFRHVGGDSWRNRSEAVHTVVSALSTNDSYAAPTTDRYALVVVNETGSTEPYAFIVQSCVDPPNLVNSVPVAIPPNPGGYVTPFEITPLVPSMPTIGLREGNPAGNWDLSIHERQGAGFPPCDGLQRMTSAGAATVEVIVGDFWSGVLTPGLTYWPTAQGAGNASEDGRIQYDAGTNLISVNGPTQYAFMSSNDVIRTLVIQLNGGSTYQIHLAKIIDAPGRFYLFRPFDTGEPFGSGWSALTGPHPPEEDIPLLGVEDFEYTAPVTGKYALVLASESAQNAGWEIAVSTCHYRTELQDGSVTPVIANTVGPFDGQALATQQTRLGWSAIGVRPFSAVEDWTVEAWDTPTGGDNVPPFGCLNGLLGATVDEGTSAVDVLVRYDEFLGEFQERVATERIAPNAHVSPGGGASAEFQLWRDDLVVNAAPLQIPMAPSDLIDVWQVRLQGGQEYTIQFEQLGAAAELFLFRTIQGCTAGCPPEYLQLNGVGQEFRTTTHREYTPPASGLYGLVVVNQGTTPGEYRIGVHESLVGVGTESPRRASFQSVAPNPVRGGVHFAFELPQPGRVGFDIVDLAGRRVARVEDTEFPAGGSLAAWNGIRSDGVRLAPGLYFARMRLAGEVVGRIKFTVVD